MFLKEPREGGPDGGESGAVPYEGGQGVQAQRRAGAGELHKVAQVPLGQGDMSEFYLLFIPADKTLLSSVEEGRERWR